MLKQNVPLFQTLATDEKYDEEQLRAIYSAFEKSVPAVRAAVENLNGKRIFTEEYDEGARYGQALGEPRDEISDE